MKKSIIAFLQILFITAVAAQTPEIQKIRAYREKQEWVWFDQFLSFLSIPNIASVPVDMQRNAVSIMEMMKRVPSGRYNYYIPKQKMHRQQYMVR